MKTILRLVIASCFICIATAQADKKREDKQVGGETEIKTVIEVETKLGSNACMANLEIEYYQKDSTAHVETVLNNDNCAASAGTYVIQVRYEDAAGEHQSKDFEEFWERDDAEPIVVTKDYFVGHDIDVLRVRSRKLSCTCATDETAVSD